MNYPLWPFVLAGIENFVLINASLSLLAFCLSVTTRFVIRSQNCHPLLLSRFYALSLLIPPLASAWLVIASLLPATWLGIDRWVQEHDASHSLHLLNALTVSLDPALAYAAMIFAAFATVLAVYSAARTYYRIGGIVRKLEVTAEPVSAEHAERFQDLCGKYGIDAGLVVSNYPFSFVWGYLQSKLIISTSLLNALSSDELAALVEHEAAHHYRRDNLARWTLTICRYLSPLFPLSSLMYRWWKEQVEMVCDEVAARRTGSPFDLASALVRVKRLSLTLLPQKFHASQSAFYSNDDQAFERRVKRVLSLIDKPEDRRVRALSRSWGRSVVMIAGMFLLSLTVTFVLSPLSVHRLIEILLHGV